MDQTAVPVYVLQPQEENNWLTNGEWPIISEQNQVKLGLPLTAAFLQPLFYT